MLKETANNLQIVLGYSLVALDSAGAVGALEIAVCAEEGQANPTLILTPVTTQER